MLWLDLLFMIQIACMPPNVEGNAFVFTECRSLHVQPSLMLCRTIGGAEVVFRNDLVVIAYNPSPDDNKNGYWERKDPLICAWDHIDTNNKKQES